MALAPVHRQGRKEPNDNYAIGDVRLAVPEGAGIDGVAGSVTSFVRKLFQMVQGECDSVVGFVADGTAFEVKDPRRLEQDILPKYFRHSRFQSLVRQLNFYSFKKISKERSVWIYKHAYFRRDEPELLHALKRKTNQHGARIGVEADPDEDLVVEHRPNREVPSRSLAQLRHDGRSRSRGPCIARGQPPVGMHSTPPFRRQPSPPSPPPLSHHHHLASVTSTRSGSEGRGSTPERPVVAGNKLQSNSRSGGDPSTGGVGGAAAPCYGRGPSSRMPGFAWSGSGGRPVSTVDDYDERDMHDTRDSGGTGSGIDCESGTGALSLHDQRKSFCSSPSSTQDYRQGPAIGENEANTFGNGRRGVKRGSGATAAPDSGPDGVDRDHALALWGLSALCQVASATAAARDQSEERVAPPQSHHSMHHDSGRWDGRGHDASYSKRGLVLSPRFDVEDDSNPQKRACRSSVSSTSATRPSWEYNEARDCGNDPSSDDEDEDEGGVTSTEREDSLSSINSRSSESHDNNTPDRPSNPPVSTITVPARTMSTTREIPSNGHRRYDGDCRPTNDMTSSFGASMSDGADGDVGRIEYRSQRSEAFPPTWGWGRSAEHDSAGLPGTFVDRRITEGYGGRNDTDGGGTGKSEEEDDDEDEEEEGENHETIEDGQEEESDSATSRKREVEEEDEEDRIDGYNGDMERNSRKECGGGGSKAHSYAKEARDVSPAPIPRRKIRDPEADREAEEAVGLLGIGTILIRFCNAQTTPASSSIYLAAVSNSGDDGLREMTVFCSGPAGNEPDTASPTVLARQVSAFLEDEAAVAEDLRIYAEALDPAAADVVKRTSSHPTSTQVAKLLRIFCRYAASRLGRALEIVSAAAEHESSDTHTAARQPGDGGIFSHQYIARRISPQLDECRWKWWRAAVRFS